MNPNNVTPGQGYFVNPRANTDSQKVKAVIDEIYTAEAQSTVITRGTGNLLGHADFGGHKVVSIYERELIPAGTYNPNSASPLKNPRPVHASVQTFALTQTASLNDKIDIIHRQDTQGVLNAQAHIADEMKHILVPMYDSHVFGTVTAFGAANGYVTTVASGKDIYHDGVIDGRTALDRRTQSTISNPCLLVTTEFEGKLRKNAKYVLATDKAQEKTVYKGMTGMIDGMEVIRVDESRWGTTYGACLIAKNIVDHVRKIADFRVNSMAEGFFGDLIQYVAYYGTFLARNRGAGLQLIIDNS